jgi:hypothetical protein
VTVAGELAALRGIARRLSTTTAPIEARTAHAWGSIITSSARSIGRAVEFLRADLEGRHPEVDLAEGDAGYEGLDAAQAASRFAGIAVRLALTASTNASDLMVERDRFVRAVALIAPSPNGRARGVAAGSPDANGAGRVRRGARETSASAALLAVPRSGLNRRKVLDAVASVARDPKLVGLTDVQIAQISGLRDNSVRPRRIELVDGGWLEPATSSDGTVRTREHYGRDHTVWVLTQKAAGTSELWQH